MGTGELSGKFFERLGLASHLGEKQCYGNQVEMCN